MRKTGVMVNTYMNLAHFRSHYRDSKQKTVVTIMIASGKKRASYYFT